MMTLEEAFRWHKAIQSQLNLFARLGRNHWDEFPAENPLWKDEHFKGLESSVIVDQSRIGLDHLNDFAVMILFSVFEATVRDRVLSRAQSERGRIESDLLAGIVDAGFGRTKLFRIL